MKGMWMSVLVLFVCALASTSVAPRVSAAGTMKEQGAMGNNTMKEEGTMKGTDTMDDRTMKDKGMTENKMMKEEGTTKGKEMMEDKTMKEEKGTMK